jgi:predicted flavoprotein YhiN
LITHWGFSGPAVLKLSAWGARELYSCGYTFDFVVNWSGEESNALKTKFKALFQKELKGKSITWPLMKSLPGYGNSSARAPAFRNDK